MKMHAGGKTKNVPIHRIIHAIHEAICPLTHANVDVHEEGFECSFILRLGIQGRRYDIPEIWDSLDLCLDSQSRIILS